MDPRAAEVVAEAVDDPAVETCDPAAAVAASRATAEAATAAVVVDTEVEVALAEVVVDTAASARAEVPSLPPRLAALRGGRRLSTQRNTTAPIPRYPTV